MSKTRTIPTATELSAANVNEIIRRYPATAAAFNKYGIDSCCGGAASVADAAARDGANAEKLVTDLAQLIAVSE